MVHRKLLNIRKPGFFFIVRVTKHWSRLLREVAESLSFELLKSLLDNGL